MLIYRVEHEHNGHGPYIIPDDPYEWEIENDDDYFWDMKDFADRLAWEHGNEQHPCPRSIPRSHVCGFDSVGALIDWFDGFEDELEHFGFVIRVFEGVAHEDSQGYGQVTFVKESANHLTTERF